MSDSFDKQLEKIGNQAGFIAALDQSGGSTPKALERYGIDGSQYTNDTEMFDLVHAMRTRIITDPAFDGDRILGTILFENTMDRDISGQKTSEYLWREKHIVPILKVDKGLEDIANGVQIMKPMGDLMGLLGRARELNVFGTKMRSVIKSADSAGIAAVVAQQFEVADTIREAGLVPIIEPEVDINSSDKRACEELLKDGLLANLSEMSGGLPVMFKLTLPDEVDFYSELLTHERVLRVVALSGGYERQVANDKLRLNRGVVASFSRALTEGLDVNQSVEEFSGVLNNTIESIYQASMT